MSDTDRAAELLTFYLAKAWEAAGLDWGSDNYAETRAIVEHVIAACTGAPGARQVRYVATDGGKYREQMVTLVPRGDGTATIYEGSPDVYGPVFDGPAHLAREYAQLRHRDLTGKGYVVLHEAKEI